MTKQNTQNISQYKSIYKMSCKMLNAIPEIKYLWNKHKDKVNTWNCKTLNGRKNKVLDRGT